MASYTKMSSEQWAKSLTDLPSNILVEILTRLPLRTLVVSRSVCKTFLCLTIPNPHFIDLHSSNAAQILVFQFQLKFGGCTNPSFLLRMADPEFDYAAIKNSNLKPLFHLPRIGENVSFHRPEKNRFSLVNSCNGLVYFYKYWAEDDGHSIVCNPVTNEYIVIPRVNSKFRRKSYTRSMWLGFSPGTNQYKILRISTSFYVDEFEAHVFVIGSDSWRHTDAPQMGKNIFLCDSCPTLINGLMYWHRHEWEDLAFFDFEREKFGEVALPPEFQKYQFRIKYCTSIGILGECLCVSYNDFDAHSVSLWVMRNPNSWTKEFVFDTARPSRGPVIGKFKPLQFLRNGQVLMLMQWIENYLVCYDPRTERLRYFRLNKRRSDVRVVPLTPSFVPLKDTLSVEKVVNVYVGPRGDENELLKEEGDFGTTNLLSRNCLRNLKKIQNMMRGVVESLCFGD